MTGSTRQLEAKDLHDAVAGFSLDAAVPEDIARHFETVKNLFIYSWFIYRFQPIAELQSLACLEYALRDRLENEIRTGKFNEKRPGLQKLLRYAIENQLVKNEGFDRWVRSQDPEWDLLASLEKALPRIRNDYAHGTYNLARQRLALSSWFARLSTNCSSRRRSNSPARAEVNGAEVPGLIWVR